MYRFFKLFIVLVLSLTFSSCMEYKEVEVVKVVDINMKEMSTEGVDISVSMQIKNPNTYNIKIVGSDLSLFLKGSKMGSVSLKDKVTLKKKSNETYHFTLQSHFKNLSFENLPVLLGLMTEDSFEVQIVGFIKAQAKGISKKVPVDFKDNVKL